MMKHLALSALFCSSLCMAALDLDQAPPSFDAQGKSVVPVNFTEVWLDIEFDAASRVATGNALIYFSAKQAGYPMLDMVPNATSVSLNGTSTTLTAIQDPTNTTTLRRVDAAVTANSQNSLRISYKLSPSTITYTNGGVRFGFFMSDLSSSQRGLLEKYAPTNFEFDAYRTTLRLSLKNATSTHRVFTNGSVEELENEWLIHFPSHFTPSSYYMHITNRNYSIKKAIYKGIQADIPVTSYAESSSLAQNGLSRALRVLKELENTYGPYAHPAALAYITPSGGGMEYCGATRTSLGALEHEFTHFWFARGVMPANGNAGWIDEAIASWRDNSYPTYSSPGQAARLAGFSDYRRATPYAAYSNGMRVMGHLHHKTTGGLKPVLKQLFSEKGLSRITTPWFESFLERVTGNSVEALFASHVYGSRLHGPEQFSPWPFSKLASEPALGHPRPYTAEEIEKYR